MASHRLGGVRHGFEDRPREAHSCLAPEEYLMIASSGAARPRAGAFFERRGHRLA
ncbi:hypothetical protein [Bosea sp. NPDC055594]